MKYLFLTIFFLASFAVSACGQIVFPSPNQVEMQKGYLTLRKKKKQKTIRKKWNSFL